MGKNKKIIKELIKKADWKYTLKIYLLWVLSNAIAYLIHPALMVLSTTVWIFLWIIGKVNFVKLKKEG